MEVERGGQRWKEVRGLGEAQGQWTEEEERERELINKFEEFTMVRRVNCERDGVWYELAD